MAGCSFQSRRFDEIVSMSTGCVDFEMFVEIARVLEQFIAVGALQWFVSSVWSVTEKRQTINNLPNFVIKTTTIKFVMKIWHENLKNESTNNLIKQMKIN